MVLKRSASYRLAALLAVLAPVHAAVPQTFTTSNLTANRPHLGVVAAAVSSVTNFRISTAPLTTVFSGTGTVVNTTGRQTQTVTVTCAGTCTGNKTATITVVSSGAPTGRAGTLTNFTVANGTGTVSGVTNITNGISFTLGTWTATGTKTFKIGLDFPINGDNVSTATSATSGYTVTSSAGAKTGTAAATIRRSISVAKVTDLQFGAVSTGAAGVTVTIAAADGARTTSGVAATLRSGLPTGRATFTVTGTPSTAVAVSVASPLTLTSGGNTMSTTLVRSANTGTLSAGGTLTFGVGGALTVPANKAGGTYSGTFTFTANYN